MAFNLNKFNNQNFERRIEEVEISALQDFFPKDKKAIFTVQGLTHPELAKAREGLQKVDNLQSLLEAAAGSKPAIKDAIQTLISNNVDVPQDTQLRILHLVSGSVEPKLDEISSIKLANCFPTEFMTLTNKIMELSGKGQVAIKKP